MRISTRSFGERDWFHVQILDVARSLERVWLVPGHAPALERGGVVAVAHSDGDADTATSVKTLRTELERDTTRTVVMLDDLAPEAAAAESSEPNDLSAQAVRTVCQDHE